MVALSKAAGEQRSLQSVDHVVDSESARIVAFIDQFCPLSMSLQLFSYLLLADGSHDSARKIQ